MGSSDMQILGEDIDLRKNLAGSFRTHKVLWMLFLLSALMDFLSTVYFMHSRCICLEANVLVRSLAYTYGILPGVLLGKLLQLFSVIGLSSLSLRLSPLVLLAITGVNLLAVVINLF